MKPWYIVYCLWRKIDAIVDGPHALKLELFKETVIPRGRTLLHAYTYMVTTPFGYKLRSPVTDSPYLHTQITSKSLFLEKKGRPRHDTKPPTIQITVRPQLTQSWGVVHVSHVQM